MYNEVKTACAVNLIYTAFAVQDTTCELYQDELPDMCLSLSGVFQNQVEKDQKPDWQM